MSSRVLRQTPELDFLVLCTHRQITEFVRQRAHQLWTSGLDHSYLYQLARFHHLDMLLYHGLVRLGIESPLRDQLADDLTQHAVLYEFIYPQQLAALLAGLQKANVPALLLKGHALGRYVYEQPALRPYIDFDLLIPLEQSETALNVLASLGYRADDTFDYPADYHMQHHHFAPQVHAEWLTVELHWRLVTPLGGVHVDLDSVWANSQTVEINGVPARILSPEHCLIYLALHGINTHLLDVGLKALCDVAQVIAAGPLDWDKITAVCHDWHCARQVWLMLRLVSEFYGEVVPSEVFTALCPQGIPTTLLRYSLSNVLNAAAAGLEQSAGLAQVWQMPDPARRWQMILGRFFPPSSQIAQNYQLDPHDWRRWFYYPRWQATLIRRHGRTAFSLLRADPEIIEQARQEKSRQDLIAWVSGE